MIGATLGTLTARMATAIIPAATGRLPTKERRIYLTIDDGPSNLTTRILELLEEQAAGSTWFLVGKATTSHADFVDRILADGHSIGNHSYGHLDAWRKRWSEIEADLEEGLTTVETIAARPCRFTRPPFGRIRPRTIGWCREHRQALMLWDVMAPDFMQDFNPARVSESVRRRVRPGSIVVMHDSGRKQQVEAIELTLSGLVADGWHVSGLPDVAGART